MYYPYGANYFRGSDIELLRIRIGSRFQDADASHWLLLGYLLIVFGVLALYLHLASE